MALSDVTTRIYELQVRMSQESLRSLKALETQVAGAAKSLDNFKAMASGALQGIMAGASVGAFFSAIQNTIGSLDDLGTAAARLGQSPETFSEMAYAAKMADVEVGDLTTSMRGAEQGDIRSRQGRLKRERHLRRARHRPDRQGHDGGDGRNRRCLHEDRRRGRRRTKCLLELFGKAGQAMRPLMEEGAEGIRAAREEAHEFGIVLDDELAIAIGEYGTNTKKLQASTEGLWTEIVRGLLPAVTAIQQAFLDAGKSGADFSIIGKAIGLVFKEIASRSLRSMVDADSDGQIGRRACGGCSRTDQRRLRADSRDLRAC